MNTGAPFPSVAEAQGRVLHFQRKLHEWASKDAERRFHDLWNLVCDPATLVVAWSRVSRNQGQGLPGSTPLLAATSKRVASIGSSPSCTRNCGRGHSGRCRSESG